MTYTNNYVITEWIDEDVQPTGTPDINAANLLNIENGIFDLGDAVESESARVDDLETDVTALQSSTLADTSFITGLELKWISTTQVQVQPGACWTPGAGQAGTNPSPITLSPTLAANDWYYVYASVLGSSLTYTVSTTEPQIYFGQAKQMTGNPAQRFIGACRTNASSQILKTLKNGNWVMYQDNINASPLKVLTDGQQLSETNVDCSGAVPVHSTLGEFYFTHYTNDNALIGNPDDNLTLSGSAFLRRIEYVPNGDARNVSTTIPLSSDQRFSYMFSGTVAVEGLSAYCLGFHETR